MEKLQQSGQRISATQGQPNHPSGKDYLIYIYLLLDYFGPFKNKEENREPANEMPDIKI